MKILEIMAKATAVVGIIILCIVVAIIKAILGSGGKA